MYKIVHVKEHYEIYYNGQFFCSTDTIHEEENEIDNA